MSIGPTRRWRRPARHAIGVLMLAGAIAGCASGEDGSVSFAEPVDGAVVASPVHVEMRAEGFTIEPAAEGVGEGRGHFHIMIDAPCVETRLTVGTDERHLHFGDGRTAADVELTPGVHTLCLQAADGAHTALRMVDVITITVAAWGPRG